MTRCNGWLLISWLIACMMDFGQADEALSDHDRDGFPLEIEAALGTDPLDPVSRPTLADNRYKLLGYWPLTNHAFEALANLVAGELRGDAMIKMP